MHLGHFKDFKGADTVLLAGSPSEIESLVERLGNFASSGESAVPIHCFASVASSKPVQLSILRSALLTQSEPLHFYWLCSPIELANIQGKLQALARSGSGHQYFNLLASHTQLVVSVGEYSPAWWQAQA